MQTNLNAPPTEWTKVTVGGKPYLMRFTQASLLLLMNWKLPIADINGWQDAEAAAGRGAGARLQLALSTLGNFGPDGDWEPLNCKPEVTAAKFLEGEWKKITEGWPSTMGKVAQPAPPTQAAPTETGPAVQ